MPAGGLPPATKRWIRIAGLLALCAGCRPSGEPAAGGGTAVRQESAAEVRELRLGRSVEREISPGETHRYSLELAEGELVDLLIEQRGIDVVTTLRSPAGDPVVEVDRLIGYSGPEPLLAVARETGTYTLVVRAFEDPMPPGRYRAEIREIRRASEEDYVRARAVALVSAGKDLEQAEKLWEDLGDDFWQAETLSQLAAAQKDPEEAVRLYEKSAALFAKAGEPRTQGDALASAGLVRYDAGAAEEAISYYLRARSVNQAAGDRSGEAATCTNLGQAFRSQGRYDRALKLYGEALKLWDEERDRGRRAQTLHNLGVLYRILGKDELAVDRLTEAEREFSAMGKSRRRAASLNQLGQLFQGRGAPEEALAYHRQALALRREVGDSEGAANTLVDIGLAHQALDRTGEALGVYLEALALLRGLEPPRPRVEAKVLFALGSLYGKLGQEREALGYLEESAELHRGFGDPAGEAESLRRLSIAYSDLGDLPAAREAAQEAVDLVERVRLSAVSPDLRSSFFSTVQNFFEHYVDLLMTSHQERPGAGFDRWALKESERARARSLLELLGEASADIRSGAAPELLAREKGLQKELNRSARKLRLLELDSQNRRSQMAEEKKLREIALALDTVRSEIRAQSPRYAALTQPRPLDLEEMQRQVPDAKTRILEYHLGEKRSFLWLVARDGLDVFVLPGREDLEGLARRTYEQLKVSNRPESRISSRRFLCELSQVLLTPAADRLAGARLVIVADGALQFIPFAALPDPNAPEGCATAPPLVVGHEIVYLPSISALAVLRQETATRTPAPGLLAVLADPVFSPEDERVRSVAGLPAQRSTPPTSHRRFPRLERSRSEAEAILSLASPEARFSAFDFQADKDTVVHGGLNRYRIVHFATHAVLDTSRPELSGLVLSQVDETGRERSDAFLRLHDLYNLDLPAELVVLSACNTALGKEVRGEGLVGLTRGFMYAGARRVVVSLWNVSDESTGRLMRRFYEGLLEERLAPAAALRQAQVAMWKEQPAPYYWAAFVFQGEWGVLPPWVGVNKDHERGPKDKDVTDTADR